MIKDLFGILANVNMNRINHAMLENIQTVKIANVGEKQIINQLKNILKILLK